LEKLNSILLKWWFLLCTQIALGTVAYHFGFFHHLYREDTTRIGFFILGLLSLTTLVLGKKVYSFKNNWMGEKEAFESISPGWFIAETCLVLGLIGTVTGFILMLGTAFTELDVTNIVSVQGALVKMSLGMSTALYTTLVGLISSLAIKIQLVTIERQLEKC
jgi:hypothetical protein